ncbi:MAG: response regulator [Patescibacteria group bacterium]
MATRILIIDDNKDFLDIFSLKLTSAGFEVTTAQSGKEGIELAKKIRPDLVLLDVEMPDMNGVETLTKLKEDQNTAALRVAFLTNYGEPQKEISWTDEKFAREAGAVDYIKKSEDLSEIVDEVKKILK